MRKLKYKVSVAFGAQGWFLLNQKKNSREHEKNGKEFLRIATSRPRRAERDFLIYMNRTKDFFESLTITRPIKIFENSFLRK